MSTYGVPHTLIVESHDLETGDIEYEIEHPDECPKVDTHHTGPDGKPVWDYGCSLAEEIYNMGLVESLDATPIFEVQYGAIPPGTYRVQHWLEKHPATPSHGEEWSGGLRVMEEGEE